MNILFVAASDPRLTDSGNMIRTHFLWSALKALGEVYTVHVYGGRQAFEGNRDEADRIHHVCADSRNPLVFILDRLLLKFTGIVRWPFRSRRAMRKAIGWPDVKFDVVVVRYISNAATIGAWRLADRCYVDIDDDPLQYFETVFRPRLPWPLSALGYMTTRAWACHVCGKSTGLWVANKMKLPVFVNRRIPALELPNLAKDPRKGYAVAGRQKRQLMSVGLMSYTPNYKGVDWFVDAVWPDFHAKHADVEYVIAGSGAPESLATKWNAKPGVRYLGFVKDLDAVYEESLAVVAPILAGSGTCVKVLEAALRGRVVFGTRFAFRGVEERVAGKRVFLNAVDFAAAFDQIDTTGNWSLKMSKNNGFEEFQNIVREMIGS